MGDRCVTFSAREGYVRVCERDENGLCVKNCVDVKIEDLHPRIAVELKRFENAVTRYT